MGVTLWERPMLNTIDSGKWTLLIQRGDTEGWHHPSSVPGLPLCGGFSLLIFSTATFFSTKAYFFYTCWIHIFYMWHLYWALNYVHVFKRIESIARNKGLYCKIKCRLHDLSVSPTWCPQAASSPWDFFQQIK